MNIRSPVHGLPAGCHRQSLSVLLPTMSSRKILKVENLYSRRERSQTRAEEWQAWWWTRFPPLKMLGKMTRTQDLMTVSSTDSPLVNDDWEQWLRGVR